MAKILITGGAGFIGSHLAEALLSRGHHVVVIDNLSTGNLDNLAFVRANERFAFIQGDILDIDQLAGVFAEIDIVYHLAAAVGVKLIVDNPLLSMQTNVRGTEHVLRLAQERRVKVVLTSTSEVYGKNDQPYLSETADRILGATNISRWSYSSSKALDEFMAFAYLRQYALPVVIARLFNTCGPRQSAQYGMVIPRFIQQALANEPITVYGTGEQTRAFTHVHDTVAALIALGSTERCVGEVYNVGNEENKIMIKDLAALVVERMATKSAITYISYAEAYEEGFEDMLYRVPDTRKIRDQIGFTPQYSLNNILDETIEYMKGDYEKRTR